MRTIDIRLLQSLHLGVIKLLCQTMQSSRELGMHCTLVGMPVIIAECSGFEDTQDWPFFESLGETKGSLGAPVAETAAVA